EMCGRSGVPERELDTGTTTTSSSSMPVMMSSTETMTAGRCSPGSLARAAPRATSHRSPRRGSVDAVIEGVVPVSFLAVDGVVGRLGTSRVAFGAEDRLMFGTRSQLGEEGGNGYSALTSLGGEAVAGLDRNPDRCRGRRHICSLLPSPARSATSLDCRYPGGLTEARLG